MQRVFAETAAQAMRLRPSPRRAARGLTRPEILWTVMLTVVIVSLIVRTRDGELQRARERYLQDGLHYLQGQIYLAMELAEARGESLAEQDFPFVGPGKLPRGLEADDVRSLETLLDGLHVPEDPWQRAYVLRLVGRPDSRHLQVLSAGPGGVMPDALDEAPPYAKPVHGPYASGE